MLFCIDGDTVFPSPIISPEVVGVKLGFGRAPWSDVPNPSKTSTGPVAAPYPAPGEMPVLLIGADKADELFVVVNGMPRDPSDPIQSGLSVGNASRYCVDWEIEVSEDI